VTIPGYNDRIGLVLDQTFLLAARERDGGGGDTKDYKLDDKSEMLKALNYNSVIKAFFHGGLKRHRCLNLSIIRDDRND
jgi:hypothetical protein